MMHASPSYQPGGTEYIYISVLLVRGAPFKIDSECRFFESSFVHAHMTLFIKTQPSGSCIFHIHVFLTAYIHYNFVTITDREYSFFDSKFVRDYKTIWNEIKLTADLNIFYLM